MNQKIDLDCDQWMQSAEVKRDYNQALFRVVAPKYDFVTKALSLGRDQAWKRILIRSLPNLDAPVCLDLACGTGDLSFALADKYSDGKIIGLDLTDEMLIEARKRSRRNNVSFRLGDMAKTELKTDSIQVVTGGYALRNAADLGGALDEISRVLKPGGVAAFLDFSKPKNRSIQRFQNWILSFWGSLWGVLLHRRRSTYGYIAKSLRQYPDRAALREMIRQRGFRMIHSQRLYFGMLEIIVLETPTNARDSEPSVNNVSSAQLEMDS